jgi:WD40 repeat protein/serine/threonine protein kinase
MPKSTNGHAWGDSTPPTLPIIPEYTVVRFIGEGSYGQVWLAQNVLGGYRAVKVIYEKRFSTKTPYNREFTGIEKFEPISRSHEGFLDVLQVGKNDADGFFYYVMELGDDKKNGQNILPNEYQPNILCSQEDQRQRFSFAECIRVGTAIASALDHLHKHGLVHRDVKPSNILFVNGAPKLADIGLVADQEKAQSNVGTDGFIPPEGHGRPQGDVYSLGKVLYEMAMGLDRHDYPRLPADWSESPELHQLIELNQVIIRACEASPLERYASAQKMLQDLRVLEAGESLTRLRVLEKRMTAAKRWGAIVSALLMILLAASALIYREYQNREQLRSAKVQALVSIGGRLTSEGNLLEALPRYTGALKLDRKDPQAEMEQRLRIGAVSRQCPKLSQCWAMPAFAIYAKFSPDGKNIAASDEAGNIMVFEVGKTDPIVTMSRSSGGARYLAFNPDGSVLLLSGMGPLVRRFRWRTGEEILPPLGHPDLVNSAEYSPDGRRIVTACSDKKAYIWDCATADIIKNMEGHADQVFAASYSHDGQRIVTGSRDHHALVWDANSGKILLQLPHNDIIYSAVFSPDDAKIATGSLDKTAQLWDAQTGNACFKPLEHIAAAATVEFSPDGRYLVTSGWDFVARVWDLKDGHLANPPLPHGGQVMSAAFSPDARYLLTTSSDKTVRIWDLEANNWLPPTVAGNFSPEGSRRCTWTSNVLTIADEVLTNSAPVLFTNNCDVEDTIWSPNGRFVFAIGSQGNRKLGTWWDVISDAKVGEIMIPKAGQNRWSINNDGKTALSFNRSAASFWIFSEKKSELPILKAMNQDDIECAAFSPNGKLFCVAVGSNTLVWSVSNPKQIHRLSHERSVKYAEFSPDSSLLVTCCYDYTFAAGYAQVWRVSDGQPAGPQMWHKDGVYYATFSPDGNRVATASEDFTAMVWNVRTGEAITPPLQHQYHVLQTHFSQNGKWLVTASEDRTVRIWDAQSGEPLTPSIKHPLSVSDAQFVKNDKAIYTKTANGLGFVWDLLPDSHSLEEIQIMAEFLSGATLGKTNPFTSSQNAVMERVQILKKSGYLKAENALDQLAWHERQAQSSEQNGQPFAARFHLKVLLTSQPTNVLWRSRYAEANAALGQWKEAEKDFAAVLRTEEEKVETWCHYAHVCLALGKTNEFFAVCGKILDLCPRVQSFADLNCVLPTLGLLPLPIESYAKAKTLEQRFGEVARVQIACGILDYRTGQHQSAERRLIYDGLHVPVNGSDALCLLFSAMNQAELDNSNAAVDALNHAENLLRLMKRENPFFARAAVTWERKLELQFLLNEAREIVERVESAQLGLK